MKPRKEPKLGQPGTCIPTGPAVPAALEPPALPHLCTLPLHYSRWTRPAAAHDAQHIHV
jgi:hypothetical protein